MRPTDRLRPLVWVGALRGGRRRFWVRVAGFEAAAATLALWDMVRRERGCNAAA
jgi:hypothetical protein